MVAKKRQMVYRQGKSKKIEYTLMECVEILIGEDGCGITNDVNERAISRRLGLYLQRALPEWDVDCEYNRDHDDPKRLDIKRRNTRSDDTQATTVFPDIIVHRRGTNDNKLVIEMKKTTSAEPDNYDLGKLREFKKQLGYELAAFVRLGTGRKTGDYELRWISANDNT